MSATRLGIDVGSVSVAAVEIDDAGGIRRSRVAAHQGHIEETVREVIALVAGPEVGWVMKTSSTPDSVCADATVDNNVAAITAVRHLHPDAASLLVMGGERFSLTRLDSDGHYLDTRTNSSCAAGTGSFLDQQAENLGLENGAELAVEASAASGEPPRIASRCAVFAKTDLIHAQQAGYGREAICDGLCRGLASIVADTVLSGEPIGDPVILAGGVANNATVRRHLQDVLATTVRVDENAQLYGALGAALSAPAEGGAPRAGLDFSAVVVSSEAERQHFFEPLDLDAIDYPEFLSAQKFNHEPQSVARAQPVEVDIYMRLRPGAAIDVFLGVDVGSTSTKAVLLSHGRRVIAGFYTRTSGRPIEAVRAILEAVWSWSRTDEVSLHVRGAGTTGSGRNLVGAVIGADLVVDEISAHARAAYELDPDTDTIIEIGGQDAKFTTMRDGMVTSAVMNTVCAAGTGTFIEEQARRLGCPLHEVGERVAGVRAPLVSDRCTVFMQRDVSHLLTHGYAVPEILAAVLHSVRENYLTKVARTGAIGERICFQGATAKNRALVAAFAQKLGAEVWVSEYCHLTGALGVSLMLAEAEPAQSRFRGVELFDTEIPVATEVCDLCHNHCKITTAEVMGETAAYGFLCGRDYEVDEYVSGNRSGFDLLKARKRVFGRTELEEPVADVTVGLPAALYMVDDLPLWQDFFARLGVRVVTSEGCPSPVTRGKKLARAEFCAPMAAYHGHVAHLLDRADFVFAPIYLEVGSPTDEVRRQYCYYSQYASPLTASMAAGGRAQVLRPLITKGLADLQTKARLYSLLKQVAGDVSFQRVADAYQDAIDNHARRRSELQEIFAVETEDAADICVVLLGRPYACLDKKMNKGIPEILGRMGIKAFFQDMLTYFDEDVRDIDELLRQMHWRYAAKILESAEVVAKTPGLYPVLVTCFKCAPDSCTIEFFRRVMDRRDKPYLFLELDDHDSAIGYETRLEAAVRAFRNHHHLSRCPATVPQSLPVNPRPARELGGRKLFLPNFDRWSCELVAAGLRREGVDAEVVHESDLTIQKSLRNNTGQCIPLNAIVQAFVDTVEARGIDPSTAALWTPESQISCNIGMWVGVLKAMLEAHGRGFERASVFVGEMTHVNLSLRCASSTYFAYQFGGMLRRMVCRVRPYERVPGTTDQLAEASLRLLRDAFEGDRPKQDALREVVDRFLAVDTSPREGRPRVAIFGDLYVRDNEIMSRDLIRFIEKHGGEVITTPYTEYVAMVADAYFGKWLREGKVGQVVINKSILATMQVLEKRYATQFARLLGPAPEVRRRSRREVLELFEVTDHHTGESLDNLIKIFHILDRDPDVSLFVQANPAFCCPSLVTEAMAHRIEEVTGVPVVTLTYDGTASTTNDALIPHLCFPRPARRRSPQASGAV